MAKARRSESAEGIACLRPFLSSLKPCSIQLIRISDLWILDLGILNLKIPKSPNL
jgi:hypothetical protein